MLLNQIIFHPLNKGRGVDLVRLKREYSFVEVFDYKEMLDLNQLIIDAHQADEEWRNKVQEQAKKYGG